MAQDANVAPEIAVQPAPDIDNPPEAEPETPRVVAPDLPEEPPKPVNRPTDLPAPAAPPSRLFAAKVAYQGGTIIAEGTPENPVRFESGTGLLIAQKIELDTIAQTVEATGAIRLEREILQKVKELRSENLPVRQRNEPRTETLTGENLRYDFKNQTGQLDAAKVLMANFNVSASALQINGRRYLAQNLVVRPGGLTPEEIKIYGTPPFSLRAKTATVLAGENGEPARLSVKGAGLFYKNTRILPVPSALFGAGGGFGGGSRENQAFQITPRIAFNSSDKILLTTRLRFPLSQQPERLALSADIGVSQRVGFRGGASLDSLNKLGRLSLRGRRADIVTTQLTSRIELDREPEATYVTPALLDFGLPGGRRAGFALGLGYGRFTERTIGTSAGAVQANRTQGTVYFSTRLNQTEGVYLDLFATNSNYTGLDSSYRNRGFEIGYEGDFLPKVRGQISYRSHSLSGATPFRFDLVEIARELRTTLDVEVTPRYIVPLDFRYDLSTHAFRDKSFGLLRSYKTFAYGVVYQQARKDLRFEIRNGF